MIVFDDIHYREVTHPPSGVGVLGWDRGDLWQNANIKYVLYVYDIGCKYIVLQKPSKW